MKRFLTLAIVVVSFVIVPTRAQEKQQPSQFKMVEFHMALLKRGPKWSASGMTKEVQSAHVAHVMSLLDSGRAIIAGPLGDKGDYDHIQRHRLPDRLY